MSKDYVCKVSRQKLCYFRDMEFFFFSKEGHQRMRGRGRERERERERTRVLDTGSKCLRLVCQNKLSLKKSCFGKPNADI